MTKKDSIIVLSTPLTPNRELGSEAIKTVERGVGLFEQGIADYIIMNGGPGLFTQQTSEGLYVPSDTHPVHCEVMRDYAKSLGVPTNNILIQDYSRDTVGEAYFVKELILAPKDWKNNVIVVRNYHKDRAEKIYKIILGPDYLTEFEGVETELDDDLETRVKEERSLQIFLQQFGDISSGHSPTIERILYESHIIYSKISPNQRLRFYQSSTS